MRRKGRGFVKWVLSDEMFVQTLKIQQPHREGQMVVNSEAPSGGQNTPACMCSIVYWPDWVCW